VDRRAFVTGVAVSFIAPLAAEAQQAERLRRVGVVSTGLAAQWARGGLNAPLRAELQDGLRDSGFIEGQNLTIHYRFAEGDVSKLSDLTTGLLQEGVEVLVVAGPAALAAAHHATTSIPIVANDYETDPVSTGLVRSLAHPGGNVTGVFLDQAELAGKWLELMRDVVPSLARVTVLHDAATPTDQLRAAHASARALRIEVNTVDIRELRDLAGAFAAAVRSRAQAVVILSSPLMSRHGRQLADLANARRLPTISLFRENVVEGCLMGYGPSLRDAYRRNGQLAGRILRGARPAEIPIERPTRFEFVVNLKTAKALGLTIPPSLLGRADQVIE